MKTVNIFLLSFAVAVTLFIHRTDGKVVQLPKAKPPQIELDDVKMVPLRPVAVQIKPRSRRQAFGAFGLNKARNRFPVQPNAGGNENVLSADNGYGLGADVNSSRVPNTAAGGTATTVNNPNNSALDDVFGTANNNNQVNQATNGQNQNTQPQTGTNSWGQATNGQGTQNQNPQGTWGEATQQQAEPNNPWFTEGGGFPAANPAAVPGYNPAPGPDYNPWLAAPETYTPTIPSVPPPRWPGPFGGYTPSTDFQFPQTWRTHHHHHNYNHNHGYSDY